MKIGGRIRVNGRNLKSKIKKISAYCQQEDLFIGTLTVKEHLTFQVIYVYMYSRCLACFFILFFIFQDNSKLSNSPIIIIIINLFSVGNKILLYNYNTNKNQL